MAGVLRPAGCEALILDLDGVLADTEPMHQKAWDVALDGIPLEKLAAVRSKWVGMASVDIVRELIRVFGLTIPAEELLARKRAAYQSLIKTNLAPFPGLREELEMWRGFPMAVATSGIRPEALVVLQILGFSGLFDPVVTSNDVPRAKPAPDCYLSAAQLLGTPPARCAVVEDSAHGIQAGVAAGMRVLVVSADAAMGGPARQPAAPRAAPPGAERVFPSTVEALRWVRRSSTRSFPRTRASP
jgi:HAD superfamily hydrolase (TIGR01509 family)